MELSSSSCVPSKTSRPSPKTMNVVRANAAIAVAVASLKVPTLGIVAEVSEQLAILIAMSHNGRCRILRIASLDNQRDDMLAVIGSRPAVGES